MIRTVDPVKPVIVVIAFPKRRMASVKRIQILHETLQPLVIGPLPKQPPVELAVRVPFGSLTDLATHEQQFLAGKQPLVPEQRAQIGKAPPVIAWHSSD